MRAKGKDPTEDYDWDKLMEHHGLANGTQPHPTDGWEHPVEFTAQDLPPFPLEALPPVLRDFVRAESESLQTPVDMMAMLSLAACAAAIGKAAVVEIKPDYQEPLNLFVAVVLPPGERKSAAVKSAYGAISDWERSETERMKTEIAYSAMKVKMIEKQIDSQMRAATKAKSADAQKSIEAEIERLTDNLTKHKEVVAPRVLADDCTVEKLVTLMCRSGGRCAQFSAEGGVFNMLGGRYSDKVNLDAYLKGHAGDDIRVDRMGRPDEFVPAPALTLGLAVQPAILDSFADNPQFRGVGLLARFLYSLPASKLGTREVDTPPVPKELRAGYHAILLRMLMMARLWGGKIQVLKMGAVARHKHFEFARWLEPQLAEFGSLEGVRDWASKCSGAVARLAGILSVLRILAIRDLSELNHIYIGVDETAVDQAITIGRYLVAHAQAAFSAMGMDERSADAKAVLRYIRKREWTTFTRRDIQQQLKNTARFKEEDVLDLALQSLEQRHFIRRIDQKPATGPGRKPGAAFEVNPHFLPSSQNARNAQSREPGEDDE